MMLHMHSPRHHVILQSFVLLMPAKSSSTHLEHRACTPTAQERLQLCVGQASPQGCLLLPGPAWAPLQAAALSPLAAPPFSPHHWAHFRSVLSQQPLLQTPAEQAVPDSLLPTSIPQSNPCMGPFPIRSDVRHSCLPWHEAIHLLHTHSLHRGIGWRCTVSTHAPRHCRPALGSCGGRRPAARPGSWGRGSQRQPGGSHQQTPQQRAARPPGASHGMAYPQASGMMTAQAEADVRYLAFACHALLNMEWLWPNLRVPASKALGISTASAGNTHPAAKGTTQTHAYRFLSPLRCTMLTPYCTESIWIDGDHTDYRGAAIVSYSS